MNMLATLRYFLPNHMELLGFGEWGALEEMDLKPLTSCSGNRKPTER